MQLSQNLWVKWGFRGNPFDTSALSLQSELLPITKAFVGRSMESSESRYLLDILRNPAGGKAIIEGEIGVGKTTFVNYHRYLWENVAEDKLLTPGQEISVYSNWQAKDLLIEVIGHLVNRVVQLIEQRKLKKSELLKKLQFFREIFYQENAELQGSAFGFGFGYNRHLNANIPHLTESQLIAYLMDMVQEIKKLGYKGVFLHFDNLELLARGDMDKCQQLFEELRDIMQLPNL